MTGAMRARQRGASPWQILLILLVITFFLTLAAKIGPVYITHYSLQSTVKALQNEPDLSSKSIPDMRSAVQRKFDVNQINVMQALCLRKELACLKIERSKTVVRIDANYEARVHIMGNVDAVVVFTNNFIEIPIPGGGG